jgi:hypothetical protein
MWNQRFVAFAFMYQNQFGLDGDYLSLPPIKVDHFREVQTFMYDVFQENQKG